MMKLAPLIAQAALNAQAQQPVWNPVLGFLLPLYAQLLVAEVQSDGRSTNAADAQERSNRCWHLANLAFSQLGFEHVPPLGCKRIERKDP